MPVAVSSGPADARGAVYDVQHTCWPRMAYYPRHSVSPGNPGKEGHVNAAAVVANILKREGVQFLIGYPVNPIIEAAAEADIRTIIVRQERTGLHMADAVSRITSGERIGVF